MSDKKKPKDNEEFLDESSENNENELDEFLDDEFEEDDSNSEKSWFKKIIILKIHSCNFRNMTIT